MYVLHTGAGMGGFAPHAVLEEAGADYRLADVDMKSGGHCTDAFGKLNPLHQVPVLETPDGAIMTESAAITLYLTDALPECGLGPAVGEPTRADYLRWMVFMSSNIYAADIRYYYSERYCDPADAKSAVQAAARKELDKLFGIIEARLQDRPFLLGAELSAADIYLLMLACWHPDMAALRADAPQLAKLFDAVKERASVARINEWHQLW